jgi:hypothetical protein
MRATYQRNNPLISTSKKIELAMYKCDTRNTEFDKTFHLVAHKRNAHRSKPDDERNIAITAWSLHRRILISDMRKICFI